MEDIGYNYFNRGITLMELSRFKDAISEFQKGLNHHPEEDFIFALIGQCHYSLNEYILAEKKLMIAIDLNPNNDYSHYILGETFLKLSQAEKAKSHFDIAIQLDPKNKKNFLGMAKYFSSIHLFSKAEEYIDKALKIDPKFYEALIAKAVVLSHKGDNENAILLSKQTLAIDPEDSLGLEAAAIIYNSAGRLNESKLFRQKKLQAAPNSNAAYEYLRAKSKSNLFASLVATTPFSRLMILFAELMLIIPLGYLSSVFSSIIFDTFLLVCCVGLVSGLSFHYFYMGYLSKKLFKKLLVFEDWQECSEFFHLSIPAICFSIFLYAKIDLCISIALFISAFGLIAIVTKTIQVALLKKASYLFLGFAYFLGLVNFILYFTSIGSIRLISQILFLAPMGYVLLFVLYVQYEEKKSRR